MTCTYQNCADCPHRPKSELSAKPFDRDVAMRSLEYSAVRLGMHWSSSDSDEIEIAAMPDIFEVMKVAPVNGSVSLTCEECGKAFKISPSRIGKRRYCSKECQANAIRGKPNPKRAIAYKGRFKGEDNPNFKGDDVSYGGLHRWVYRNIPKPGVCPRCGITPTRGRIEAHNISGTYQRNPQDWEYLCSVCHREVDGRHETLVNNAEHRDKKGRLLLGCSKIVDAEALQARARMLREPCAAVIAREGRS